MVVWKFDGEWVLTPQQNRSRITTTKILDAAYRLFTTRGYGETSLQDVAAESGVSIGAIYTRFNDKDAILYTIVDNYGRDVTNDFLKVFDRSNWLQSEASEIICGFIDIFFVDHREYTGILNLIELRRLTDGLKIKVNSDYINIVNQRLADLLKEKLPEVSESLITTRVAIAHHVLRTTITGTSLLEKAGALPSFPLNDATLKAELKRMMLRYLGLPETLTDLDDNLPALQLRMKWRPERQF